MGEGGSKHVTDKPYNVEGTPFYKYGMLKSPIGISRVRKIVKCSSYPSHHSVGNPQDYEVRRCLF